MPVISILFLAALIFLVCFLVDKAFAKAFRSKAQHLSGTAVRVSKRYGLIGLILLILGVLALINSFGNAFLIIGGIAVGLMGGAMVVYYLTCGIFYDADTFLTATFGKKDRVYNYNQIKGQKLYLIQGGNVIVELHMTDGKVVSVQTQHQGAFPFLDTAFAGWCRQRNMEPQSCDFHNPDQCCWFPEVED